MKNVEIHYFYKITNLINGKFYYGIRTCHCLPGKDPYMGSGVYLHRAYRKYGIQNFKKEVLRICKTREDLKDLERWIVTDELVKNPMCYNLCLGGGESTAFEGVVVIIDGKYSIITKEEYRKNKHKYTTPENGKVIVYDDIEGRYRKIPLDEYYKYKESKRYTNPFSKRSSKGFISVKDKNGNTSRVDKNDHRYLSGLLVPIWKGRKHSDESRKRMSISNSISHLGEKNNMYGKTIINNGIINKSINKTEVSEFLSNNKEFKKGKITKFINKNNKLSIIYKFKELDELSDILSNLPKIKKFNYTNGDRNVVIDSSQIQEYESNGYWRGLTQRKKHVHNPNSGNKGKMWIRNKFTEEVKLINKNDFNLYSPEEWERGGYRNKKAV